MRGGRKTGKTLFRVHKSFFERESEVFRNLFAQAAKDDPEAGTDASPFTLDVKPEEFEKFLWVWYDRRVVTDSDSVERIGLPFDRIGTIHIGSRPRIIG